MHPQRNIIESAIHCIINEISLPSNPDNAVKKPYDLDFHDAAESDIFNSMKENHGPDWHKDDTHWNSYQDTIKKVNPMGHHAGRAAITMIKNVTRLLPKPDVAEATKISHSLHTDKPYYGSLGETTVKATANMVHMNHFGSYKQSIQKHHPEYGDGSHHEDQFRKQVKTFSTIHFNNMNEGNI